jgi:signal peptidase I
MTEKNKDNRGKQKGFLAEAGLFLLDILYNAVIIILLVVLIRSFIVSPFRVVGSSMENTLHSGEFIIIDKISYILGNVERGDPIVFLPPVNRRQAPDFDEKAMTDASGKGTLDIGELSKPKESPYCQNSFLSYFFFCKVTVNAGDLVFMAPIEEKLIGDGRGANWDAVDVAPVKKAHIKEDRFTFQAEPETTYALHFYPPIGEDYFVKRVIGVPGDEVKIENGRVYLKRPQDEEFFEIKEPYLNSENLNRTFISLKDYPSIFKVPDDHFFVLGDNRNHSNDSRSWITPLTHEPNPFISQENISGKVLMVLFPLSDVRLIPSADYSP